MGALARRPPLARFPDLVGWLESPWASLLLFTPAPAFPVHNCDEDGRYGSLTRSVTLPASADAEKAATRYDQGSARGQRPRPGAGHASTPPHGRPASPLNDRPAWAVPQRRQS